MPHVCTVTHADNVNLILALSEAMQDLMVTRKKHAYSGRRPIRRQGPVAATPRTAKPNCLDENPKYLKYASLPPESVARHINTVVRHESKRGGFLKGGEPYIGHGTPASAEQGRLKEILFERYLKIIRVPKGGKPGKPFRSPRLVLESARNDLMCSDFSSPISTSQARHRDHHKEKITRLPQPGTPIPDRGMLTGYIESQLEPAEIRILALGNCRCRRKLAYEWRRGLKGYGVDGTVQYRSFLKIALRTAEVPVVNEYARSPLRVNHSAPR